MHSIQSYVKEMESIDMLPMLPEELVGRKNELFSNWSELFSFHSEYVLILTCLPIWVLNITVYKCQM